MNDYVKELLQNIEEDVKHEQLPILEFNKKTIQETEEAYNEIFRRIIKKYKEIKTYNTEEEFNKLVNEKESVNEWIVLNVQRLYKLYQINMDVPYIKDNSSTLEKYLKIPDNHGNTKARRYGLYRVNKVIQDFIVDSKLLETLFTKDGFTVTIKNDEDNGDLVDFYIRMELEKFEQLIKDNTKEITSKRK